MDIELRNRIACLIEEDDRARAEREHEDWARRKRAATPPPIAPQPPPVVLPSVELITAAVKQAIAWDRPECEQELAEAVRPMREKLVALRARIEILTSFAKQQLRSRQR